MPRTSKTRRSTKHRGNAAGIIEARGRTGRKPTPAEKGGSGRGTGQRGGKGSSGPRPKRYEQPPTWKSAAVRAVLAAAVVYLVSALLLKRPVKDNIILFPIVLVLYAPLIYYTDLWMYKRHVRKKAAG
jgi:hypothetical protein